MYKTLYDDLFPQLRAHASLRDRVQFIFRQQIQPWHPSSTLTHEAALAVQRLAPQDFWAFSAALFDAQRDYFDLRVVAEPRNATYARLARLAESSTPQARLDGAKVLALLRVRDPAPGEKVEPEELNGGNELTADVKTVVKMARLVGVHVSPTVIVDGVVAADISSGWSAEQWIKYLEQAVA